MGASNSTWLEIISIVTMASVLIPLFFPKVFGDGSQSKKPKAPKQSLKD